MSRVALVIVIALALSSTGCAVLAGAYLANVSPTSGRPTSGPSHRPTTSRQWTEQEKRVGEELANIEGATPVLEAERLTGQGLSVDHTFRVDANTCYHVVLMSSFDAPLSVTVAGASTDTPIHKFSFYYNNRFDTTPATQVMCTDHAGPMLVRVKALTAQGSINQDELHEYTLGVAAVPETADQAAERRARDEEIYAKHKAHAEAVARAQMPWFEGMLYETRPAPIGPFSRLKFGMSAQEAYEAVDASVSNGKWRAPDASHSTMKLELDRGYFSKIVGYIYVDQPAATMQKYWGEGEELVIGSSRALFWFDPETQTRASLQIPSSGKQHVMTIESYTPFQAIARDGGLGEAFEGLLGASVEEVRQRFDWRVIEFSEKKGEMIVQLPPLPHERFSTRMKIEFSDYKVTAFELRYSPRLHPDALSAAYSALATGFGAPTEVEKRGKPVQFYNKSNPEITAWEGIGGMAIRVSSESTRNFL